MNDIQRLTYKHNPTQQDNKHLPTTLRIPAAERKYSEAVNLYATTELSISKIAELTGVTPSGLSAHIGRHHRHLLFARYGLDVNNPDVKALKVKPAKGQSSATHIKYKEAIEACGDIAYIEYNVAQVARLFNLDGTALASQLRTHYPDVIPNRERVRQNLGIADNTHRGARPQSVQQYAEALAMYRDTDLTIPQVAERCSVSKGGFSQFMRFYHQDIIARKATQREAAIAKYGTRQIGKLSGNGNLYGPKPETVALYAPALELYQKSGMTIREIAKTTGVSAEGFKTYLHRWQRSLKPRRRAEAKYAQAIESLKSNPRPVAEVAAQFALNPDLFREYLKAHRPELAEQQGMARLADGKVVKRSSMEKYRDAISEYAGSTESLRNIAGRHGIPYKSIMGYMLRNCPSERESHNKLVKQAADADKREYKENIAI